MHSEEYHAARHPHDSSMQTSMEPSKYVWQGQKGLHQHCEGLDPSRRRTAVNRTLYVTTAPEISSAVNWGIEHPLGELCVVPVMSSRLSSTRVARLWRPPTMPAPQHHTLQRLGQHRPTLMCHSTSQLGTCRRQDVCR